MLGPLTGANSEIGGVSTTSLPLLSWELGPHTCETQISEMRKVGSVGIGNTINESCGTRLRIFSS